MGVPVSKLVALGILVMSRMVELPYHQQTPISACLYHIITYVRCLVPTISTKNWSDLLGKSTDGLRLKHPVSTRLHAPQRVQQ